MNKLSYSQFDQDSWVLKNSPNGKYFVEIGAGDGILKSNTYLLEKRGWKGICVEPFQKNFEKLKKNRSCHVEKRCIWGKSNQIVPFYECKNNYFSGIPDCFEDGHANKRKQGRTIARHTLSLDDLLKKFNAPKVIDYLSLDTEGSELAILKGFSFDYIFRLITVEHNRVHYKKNGIRKLLESNGYIKLESKAIEDWYGHKNWFKKDKQ